LKLQLGLLLKIGDFFIAKFELLFVKKKKQERNAIESLC